MVKQLDPRAHQVVHARVGVGGCGEAGQTLVVHKNSEGITGGYQHINPKVELEPVNDEGLGKKRDSQNSHWPTIWLDFAQSIIQSLARGVGLVTLPSPMILQESLMHYQLLGP